MAAKLQAPFPYFGGKSAIAALVWERLGQVAHYIEPFAGSLAVLLARPHPPGVETINDLDAFLVNFWRAVSLAPEAVAQLADYPVLEWDLHVRHKWLQTQREQLTLRLDADPHAYDIELAAWWVWGMSTSICGSWQLRQPLRTRPHLGTKGEGIHALTRLRRLPELFAHLAQRLRQVRVCRGDWTRVCTPALLFSQGLALPGTATGVFLDPPYAQKERDKTLYSHDSPGLAAEVQAWATSQGDDPRLRIALCGYDLTMPAGWSCVRWRTKGGHGNQGVGRGRANGRRETVWFSPHCLPTAQIPLFAGD